MTSPLSTSTRVASQEHPRTIYTNLTPCGTICTSFLIFVLVALLVKLMYLDVSWGLLSWMQISVNSRPNVSCEVLLPWTCVDPWLHKQDHLTISWLSLMLLNHSETASFAELLHSHDVAVESRELTGDSCGNLRSFGSKCSRGSRTFRFLLRTSLQQCQCNHGWPTHRACARSKWRSWVALGGGSEHSQCIQAKALVLSWCRPRLACGAWNGCQGCVSLTRDLGASQELRHQHCPGMGADPWNRPGGGARQDLGIEAALAQSQRPLLRVSAGRAALDPHRVCHWCGSGRCLPWPGCGLPLQGHQIWWNSMPRQFPSWLCCEYCWFHHLSDLDCLLPVLRSKCMRCRCELVPSVLATGLLWWPTLVKWLLLERLWRRIATSVRTGLLSSRSLALLMQDCSITRKCNITNLLYVVFVFSTTKPKPSIEKHRRMV